MHNTVKTVYRLCLAVIIFIVTLALLFTCGHKTREILHAEQSYQNARQVDLVSTATRQFVLVSKSEKPDRGVFLLIAGQGYISKMNCDHYPSLCVAQYDQSHTRQITRMSLINIDQHVYLKQLEFNDTRSGKSTQLSFDHEQIRNAYLTDMNNLKYSVFAIALFSCAALFVTFKILRNFRRFIGK
jgi:hypothetical protein